MRERLRSEARKEFAPYDERPDQLAHDAAGAVDLDGRHTLPDTNSSGVEDRLKTVAVGAGDAVSHTWIGRCIASVLPMMPVSASAASECSEPLIVSVAIPPCTSREISYGCDPGGVAR
jgi:hypothetical protein